MFTHCVFFWLKEGLSSSEKAAFELRLNTLPSIRGVLGGTAGVPASTDRPVVERSYSYGLVLTFADRAGHDAYQVDPIHDEFHRTCSPYWTKVLVYDVVDDVTLG
jgi:hypothetical protein